MGAYDLPYFSKSKLLTKDDIIKEFTGGPELVQYIPDSCKQALSQDHFYYLLFLIFDEKYILNYITLINRQK